MTEHEHNLMTEDGLARLHLELAGLEGAGRQAIAAQIRTAREWGDLKENGEYHAAKDAQAHLETRIAQLRDRIQTAKVVKIATGDVVGFGSSVELRDGGTGRTTVYTLVSSREAAPAEGRLSIESPVAVALLGLKAGDVATVASPRGERRLTVVSVN